MKTFLKYLIFTYFVLNTLFFFFPRNYFGEIRISFLPYNIILSLIFIILYIVFFLKFWYKIKFFFDFSKNNWNVFKKVSYIFLFIFVLLQFFIILQSSQKYFSFYKYDFVGSNQKIPDLTFFYANIHKNNLTYTWIVWPIKKYNPDVVLLVEYEKWHHKILWNFFKKNYPFVNRIYLGIYAWNVIFSKYPLKNLSDKIQLKPWRFGYVQVQKNNRKYYFYLIHTSSPVLPWEYKNRNQQLEYLSQILNSQYNINKNYDTFVLWDFNLSPWSPYFQEFTKNLKWFVDITSYIPFCTTWWFMKFPLRSHIDHIFYNKPENLIYLKKINITWIKHDWFVWSDHDWFIVKVK